MKFFKRVLLLLSVLLGVAVVCCALGLWLFRAEPDWYKRPTFTAEQREAAAQRATNKLALIQNQAARARAQERMNRDGATTVPATNPAGNAITVSFTDDELNAFFDKWVAWNDWKAGYERYISDPVIFLNDGRIILAARAKELNTVASLHFGPKIDSQGRLHVGLDRVLGGNLPRPAAVLGDYRRRLAQSMRQRLPQWRAAAAMDRSGAPNSSAISATMAALLLHVLADEPAYPVLFLPLVDRGAVAVKLSAVKVENRALTLTVEPLSAAERAALLERIKQGTSAAANAR